MPRKIELFYITLSLYEPKTRWHPGRIIKYILKWPFFRAPHNSCSTKSRLKTRHAGNVQLHPVHVHYTQLPDSWPHHLSHWRHEWPSLRTVLTDSKPKELTRHCSGEPKQVRYVTLVSQFRASQIRLASYLGVKKIYFSPREWLYQATEALFLYIAWTNIPEITIEYHYANSPLQQQSGNKVDFWSIICTCNNSCIHRAAVSMWDRRSDHPALPLPHHPQH